MAWAPSYAILTARAIPDNLLAFCLDDTRQQDALTWAGGTNLKLIKSFSITNAARERPVYPLILFQSDAEEQSFDGDLITAIYVVTFQLQIQNADPDVLVSSARVYTQAMLSMMNDIPAATLLTGTGAVVVKSQTLATEFRAIKMNDARNDFLQEVDIRWAYTLTDGAYN